jgi:hypothetical protein
MGALVKVGVMTSLDPQHHAMGNNASNTSCASPASLREVYLAKDWLEWGFVTLCGGAGPAAGALQLRCSPMC